MPLPPTISSPVIYSLLASIDSYRRSSNYRCTPSAHPLPSPLVCHLITDVHHQPTHCHSPPTAIFSRRSSNYRCTPSAHPLPSPSYLITDVHHQPTHCHRPPTAISSRRSSNYRCTPSAHPLPSPLVGHLITDVHNQPTHCHTFNTTTSLWYITCWDHEALIPVITEITCWDHEGQTQFYSDQNLLYLYSTMTSCVAVS